MFEILIFYNEGRENYRINFISSTNYAISQFFCLVCPCLTIKLRIQVLSSLLR